MRDAGRLLGIFCFALAGFALLGAGLLFYWSGRISWPLSGFALLSLAFGIHTRYLGKRRRE